MPLQLHPKKQILKPPIIKLSVIVISTQKNVNAECGDCLFFSFSRKCHKLLPLIFSYTLENNQTQWQLFDLNSEYTRKAMSEILITVVIKK